MVDYEERFFWDKLLVFINIDLEEVDVRIKTRTLIDRVLEHPELEHLFSESTANSFKDKLKSLKYNNVYHVLDELLFVVLQDQKVLDKLKMEEIVNKEPFKHLMGLVTEIYKGMFEKTIEPTEKGGVQDERFSCKDRAVYLEVEALMYSHKLSDEQRLLILEFISKKFPHSLIKIAEERTAFDLQTLDLTEAKGLLELIKKLRNSAE